METAQRQDKPTLNFTIAVPHFLVRLYQKLPNSLWRAILLMFAFGVGVGCGTLALKQTLQWFGNRPLPPLPDRQWPEFSFPEYGFKAKLSTEWNEPLHELDYKLSLMPSDTTNSEEFFSRFSYAQHGIWMAHVSLNVYDKRHFIVGSSDNFLSLFTTIIGSDGKKSRADYQGKLFLSGDEYAALAGWKLTVSGLAPLNRNSANVNAPQSFGAILEGDDVITGFSVMESNLATSGGLTFHIYKDAEIDKAIEWGVDSTRVHYECSPALECTLDTKGSGVVLHAKLRK